MLIARGLRHIFQDAQAIFNGAFAVRRHLLPLGEHVVADVVLLLPGERIPDAHAILQFLSLCRSLFLQRAIVIEDALFFLRRQIVVARWRNIRGRRAIRVYGAATGAVPIRSRVTRGVAILRTRRGLPLELLSMLLVSLLLLLLLMLGLILRVTLPLVRSLVVRSLAGMRSAVRMRRGVRRGIGRLRRGSASGAHMLRESRRNS